VNIALLFDWSAYSEAGNYWYKIRDSVFSSGIIQRSARHMKLSVGDVLTGLRRGDDADAIFHKLFLKSDWSIFKSGRLEQAFPCVFGMVFENMPKSLASELHDSLLSEEGYIGTISVHFEFGSHLVYYRTNLIPTFRLNGTTMRSFFSMGEEDGNDEFELQAMKQLGYEDVGFEDQGAKRTILDDFDTLSHFHRISEFRKVVSHGLVNGEDDAYELTMILEDLSPKLFDALGAAAKALRVAETEEDVAQVALSGRRYLEQLADALFPATNETRSGRRLDSAAYKNRIWAYCEDHITNSQQSLSQIGKEVDRLVDQFNSGLHSNRTKEQLEALLAELATLTAKLLTLNPSSARNSYRPYAGSIREFWRKV
jgi:hypothetical protein